MKIKATDLYKGIRLHIAPLLKELGWKRLKEMPGWYKPHNDEYLGFWFQCDEWGWEPEWGQGLRLSFEFSVFLK